MPWEWVGPTSIAAVGVVGIVATYLSGKRQQDTALKVARLNIDAQHASEHEERHQRRIENAYTKLLVRLSQLREWARSVYPLWTSTREEFTMPPRAAASTEEEAAVTAIWSPRVQQLMDRYDAALVDIRDAAWAITDARKTESRGQESGIDTATEHKKLDRAKQDLLAADSMIRRQISAELCGEHDRHTKDEPPRGELPQ